MLMSEVLARSRSPAETPEALFSLPFGNLPDRKPRRRRRFRSSAFTGGAGNGNRRSPITPLLQWKFEETVDSTGVTILKHSEAMGEARPAVSARKLASLIRGLRIHETGGAGKANQGLELNGNELHRSYSARANCINLYPDNKNESCSFLAIKNHKGDTSHKPEGCVSSLHSPIEKTKRWDAGPSNLSKDAFDLCGSLRLLKDQQSNTFSIISFFQSELELARSRVSELEAEKQSAKKKLDCFVKKIEDQKAAWKRRELEKAQSIIDAIKEDLSRERKSRKRLEIINAKLINELTEAKLSAKQLLEDFEKETKARELMEEVCNELAKEIGDDKAEVEALKIEAFKNRQEVEEERKMLQMAEVWREERVQMKLLDAKLTLEEKYSQLSKLQEEIEAFLRSRSGNNFNVSEMNQAKSLKEAVRSIEAHDIQELSYQPASASQDIFSIFEELQPAEHVNEKEIEQCCGVSEKPTNRHSGLMLDGHDDEEDDSGWETATHVEEEQGSSSVNGAYLESHASVSGIDIRFGGDGKKNREINELFPISMSQSRKKGSSIYRLWKSSRSSNAEDLKKISLEFSNVGLRNGRLSSATLSPPRKSGDPGLSSPHAGNWSSPDLLNPNITVGMTGRAQWLRGSKKQSLKAKLMEARFQSQKVQLRQILEQKI